MIPNNKMLMCDIHFKDGTTRTMHNVVVDFKHRVVLGYFGLAPKEKFNDLHLHYENKGFVPFEDIKYAEDIGSSPWFEEEKK